MMKPKRIPFDMERYEQNQYISQTMEYCKKYGGYIEINNDFCVYAFYDGVEHWIGYASPVDFDWFERQFE